jgi:rfaE bifunctional protein nucleotidyltransferase chain/domain
LGQFISQDKLILQRQAWKRNGQSVVFVSGCFDLLHPGHIRLLEQARSYGDLLVVGVQSDAGVRATKDEGAANAGPNVARPINPAAERAEILASLAAVDYVVEFGENSPETLIGRLSPDLIVHGAAPGSDTGSPAEPKDASDSTTAKIVPILLEPGYSTAQLLERIAQPRA